MLLVKVAGVKRTYELFDLLTLQYTNNGYRGGDEVRNNSAYNMIIQTLLVYYYYNNNNK